MKESSELDRFLYGVLVGIFLVYVMLYCYRHGLKTGISVGKEKAARAKKVPIEQPEEAAA